MNVTVVVGVDYSEASKEALRLAAQEARWRQAPLIAVSAYGSENDRLQSLEAGCELHLVKPADPRFIESLLG